jgi:SAM-dependent methyltransferase
VRRLDPPIEGVVAALDLEPHSIVVELGAGAGHFTIPIAHWLEELDGDGLIFGLDGSQILLGRLEQTMVERGLDLRIRPMPLPRIEGGELPIRDASVDRVLAVNAVHYMEQPVPTYREISRILKPGGFALLVDWRRTDLVVPGAIEERRIDIDSVTLDILVSGNLVPRSVRLPGYQFALRALKRSSEPLKS